MKSSRATTGFEKEVVRLGQGQDTKQSTPLSLISRQENIKSPKRHKELEFPVGKGP